MDTYYIIDLYHLERGRTTYSISVPVHCRISVQAFYEAAFITDSILDLATCSNCLHFKKDCVQNKEVLDFRRV